MINHNINHIEGTNLSHVGGIAPQLFLAVPFVLCLLMYMVAAILSGRRHRPWPLYRTGYWCFGVLFAVIAVTDPLAIRSHDNFIYHILVHLFLGMLAPLLMVMAAPMTLVYRTLSVRCARRLSLIVRSRPLQMVTHPLVASLLNIGGLWVLYTTSLYSQMHENTVLHVLIHFHVFLAGYLFNSFNALY